MTPNQVTVVATAVTVAGSWLLGATRPEQRLLGFCLFQYGFVLDCTDGQLARLTETTSAFGAALDEVSDRAGELYLIDRLGAAGAEPRLAGGAAGFLLTRHVLSRLFHTTLKQSSSGDPSSDTVPSPAPSGVSIEQQLRAASNLTIGDRLGVVTLASVISPKSGIRAHAVLGLAGVVRDLAARRHRGVDRPTPAQLATFVAAAVALVLSARVTTNPSAQAVVPYVLLSICRRFIERGDE